MEVLQFKDCKRLLSLGMALLLSFPFNAQAWGPGPGGVSVPVIKLNLDEEKAFLDQFHAQKKEIISHPEWKEIRGSYFLDLSKASSSAGGKKPIRLVMVPQQKNFQYWNLYAQENINNVWEYKYKGSPLGYVDNGESREPKFISYLTSSSLQSALDKLKIAYYVPKLAPEKIDPEFVATQYPSAMAGLMCEDMVTQQFSKDAFDLVPSVYDVFPEDVKKAVREGKNYSAQKKYMEGSQNVSPTVFGASKNSNFHLAQVDLVRKARDEALKTTLAAVINFQHRFLGTKNKQSWISALSDPNNLQDNTVNSGRFKRMIKENLDSVLSQVPPTMSVDQKLKAIAQINQLHLSIDMSCSAAQESYKKSNASVGHVMYGEKPYTASDRQVMKFNQDNQNARSNLEKKYREKHVPEINAVIEKNELALLFGSKVFQEKIGSFDAGDCFKTGKSGLKQISLADVYLGQSDSIKYLFEALDDRVEEYSSEEYMEILKTYVSSYPLMMKNINNRFISTYGKDMDQLRLSCLVIDEIYEEDKREQYLDYAFMGVAFVAGALTAGAGFVATVSVMGGITAIEATEAGLDWYRGYQLEGHARKGLLTKNNTVLNGLQVADRGKSIQTQAKWDFGLTMVSYGAGDVLAEGYKASKTAVNHVVKNTDVVISGADEIKHIQPVQPIQLQPVSEIPLTTKSVVSDGGLSRTDLKIAAGTGAKQTDQVIEELSPEFIEANKKLQKNFGDNYRLLHIEDGDGLVVNAKGELQDIFIHKEMIEIERVVTKKTVGNLTWEMQGGSIVKTAKVDDGMIVQILDQSKQLKINFADGRSIVTKIDDSMNDYISAFMVSTTDQAANLSEGFIFRSGDKLLLIKPDGEVFKGKRVGSEIIFSNSVEEIYVGAYCHPIYTVESEKWGKPSQWQRVSWDGDSSNVSDFEIPTLKDDGLPSGYGEINCSGLAFSGDAWLSKRSPLSCALPDNYFKDIVGSHITDAKEVMGKSPTVTPQNAAAHYGSKHEIFDSYEDVHSRLMKMDEGATALVYVKDTNGYAHVHNARKEGDRVVYYDFQARTVSTDPRAQFFNNKTHKIDVVETTQHHHGESGLRSNPNTTQGDNHVSAGSRSQRISDTRVEIPSSNLLIDQPNAFLTNPYRPLRSYEPVVETKATTIKSRFEPTIPNQGYRSETIAPFVKKMEELVEPYDAIVFENNNRFVESLRESYQSKPRRFRSGQASDMGQENAARIDGRIAQMNQNALIYKTAIQNFMLHSKPENVLAMWRMLSNLPTIDQKNYWDLVRRLNDKELKNVVLPFRMIQSNQLEHLFKTQPSLFGLEKSGTVFDSSIHKMDIHKMYQFSGSKVDASREWHQVDMDQTVTRSILQNHHETSPVAIGLNQIMKVGDGEVWVRGYPMVKNPDGSLTLQDDFPLVVALKKNEQGHLMFSGLVTSGNFDQIHILKNHGFDPTKYESNSLLKKINQGADEDAKNALARMMTEFDSLGLNVSKNLYVHGSQIKTSTLAQINQAFRRPEITSEISMGGYQLADNNLTNLTRTENSTLGLANIAADNVTLVFQVENYLTVSGSRAVLDHRNYRLHRILQDVDPNSGEIQYFVYLY